MNIVVTDSSSDILFRRRRAQAAINAVVSKALDEMQRMRFRHARDCADALIAAIKLERIIHGEASEISRVHVTQSLADIISPPALDRA